MAMRARAVLTDIEGTTSSIAFVTDILFPYARERMAGYVAANEAAGAPILADVPGENVPAKLATLAAWMDIDAKETPLKALQGLIWADGYADGALKGHVYADAAEGLRRWKAAGIDLYVYSSGSIAAQKLIFGHSIEGDLTPLFSGYFDTTSGPKREAASYARIAEAIGLPATDILFLSDMPAEIDAARAAGMAAIQVDRAGGGSGVSSFAEIQP